MAPQRYSSLGVVSFLSLGIAWGCAGLIGIEDATCDVAFDPSCAAIEMLQVAGGSGGGSGASGTSGGGTGGAAMAAGASGAGGVPPIVAGVGGSAGGSAAGAAGAPSMEEEPAEAEPTLCERYCSTIATACTGTNEQYASPNACLAVCEKLDPGSLGVNSNSVECRLARAELARDSGEPENYCHIAGPGGGGVCGSDCNGYCTVMAKTCTSLGDYDNCMPLCEMVPNLADGPDTVFYNTAIDEGDSVQCRLFHVTAATLDAFTHCEHAAGFAICAEF